LSREETDKALVQAMSTAAKLTSWASIESSRRIELSRQRTRLLARESVA
jgi:hypothetical protein